MMNSFRIALVAAMVASSASIVLAAPTLPLPQPRVNFAMAAPTLPLPQPRIHLAETAPTLPLPQPRIQTAC